jgi:hypothetical protein
VIAVKCHAQLRERALDEGRLQNDASEADIARRLQIDLVKRRRQIIRTIAGTELAEGFGVSDREFLVRAKSLYRVADLLHLS